MNFAQETFCICVVDDQFAENVRRQMIPRCLLTLQAFRASALVYLHSVLSGDFVNCKEIAGGVAHAINWLKQVPELSARSVVRNVLFCIFIFRCPTDIPRQSSSSRRLAMQHKSVGNCVDVKHLIQQVWLNGRLPTSSPSTGKPRATNTDDEMRFFTPNFGRSRSFLSHWHVLSSGQVLAS